MGTEPETRKYVPQLVWYRPFEPLAFAAIRFGTGLIVLMHGVQRLFYGAAVKELGPQLAALSPSAVGTVELIGGTALALGLLTRPLALLFALEWLAVALSAHIPPEKSWFMFGATEHFPAFLAVLCLACMMRGGGRYSIDRLLPKEF